MTNDAVSIECDNAEALYFLGGDGVHCNRDIRFAGKMRLDHGTVVHFVDVIPCEHKDKFFGLFDDKVDVGS